MSTTIYLARHGEYLNPTGIIPYRSVGYPLTPKGQNQAESQAEILRGQILTDIYCSPITRCVETATIIANKFGKAPIICDELIETGTPLNGFTPAELATMSPDYPFAIKDHQQGGGETPEDIYSRMQKLVVELTSTDHNSAYLLVSHGDPITIFLAMTIKGIIPHTMSEFDNTVRYIPQGGLVKLIYNNGSEPEYFELI